MATQGAPKQWLLTKSETITSFESWRQNLLYTLSLDANFAPFLAEGVTWKKKSTADAKRGLTDDKAPTPEANRKTAAQKLVQLELMPGQFLSSHCTQFHY